MTRGTDLITSVKKKAARMFAVLLAGAGFVAGAVICVIPLGLPALPTPDMTSAFALSDPVRTLTECFLSELKYALLIYLLGFCTFGAVAPGAVVALRALLAGYSAAYMLRGGYPLTLYFIHTAFSFALLIALCLLARTSSGFSAEYCRGKGGLTGAGVLSYTARALFYTGILLFSVVTRHALLMLIH